jgi:nitrite reductase (NO-forming)
METQLRRHRQAAYCLLLTLLVTTALTLPSAIAQDKAAQMAKGEKIYKTYCVTCHQANGQGLSGIYPPVAASDYIKTKPKAAIVSSVINGLNGPITVNGKPYNGVMNPLPSNYTDDDAANVLTYVYNSWGNPGTVVSVAEVKAARAKKPSKRGK